MLQERQSQLEAVHELQSRTFPISLTNKHNTLQSVQEMLAPEFNDALSTVYTAALKYDYMGDLSEKMRHIIGGIRPREPSGGWLYRRQKILLCSRIGQPSTMKVAATTLYQKVSPEPTALFNGTRSFCRCWFTNYWSSSKVKPVYVRNWYHRRPGSWALGMWKLIMVGITIGKILFRLWQHSNALGDMSFTGRRSSDRRRTDSCGFLAAMELW